MMSNQWDILDILFIPWVPSLPIYILVVVTIDTMEYIHLAMLVIVFQGILVNGPDGGPPGVGAYGGDLSCRIPPEGDGGFPSGGLPGPPELLEHLKHKDLEDLRDLRDHQITRTSWHMR